MLISQLSPGDKMSLKGKIFELQKKLNILDVGQQNTEDFSFHPEITQYKLPNRKDDFINNLSEADESRKDRFEVLKKQLIIERSQDCSFAPQINRRKKDRENKSQKPVHLRLTEKGQEYHDSAEKRKEMCKSHDFDGKELFKPMSVQQPRVGKGNMQVEEYLFRDAKDRVEKMDIKRENEMKSLAQVASKPKMNKHSALLVKRKCEREAREIFDNMHSLIPAATSETEEGGAEDSNPVISSAHVKKTTVAMLKFFEQHKGSLSFHNGITTATSPYEVSDRIWTILNSEETCDVSLREFLAVVIPVLVAGGSSDASVVSVAASGDKDQNQGGGRDVTPADKSYLYQFLSATHYYFNKKKAQDKENESLIAKKIVRKASSTARNRKQSDTLVSVSQVGSEDEDQSQGHQTDASDVISISDSMKSYKEQTAMNRRIQSYNKVLTEREVLANNRLEMLRESLIQKEMQECTFQPRISATAQKLKDKEREMSQSVLIDESGSVAPVPRVYDRLYAEKDSVPRSIAQEKHAPSSTRGLDECTFVPQLVHAQYAPFNHNPSTDDSSSSIATEPSNVVKNERRQSRMEKNMSSFFGDLELESGNQNIFKPPGADAVNKKQEKQHHKKPPKAEAAVQMATAPRGYSDSIRRIREAALNKKKKEEEDEAFFAVNEERYHKGLQSMAEGPKPFRFRTEERRSEKEKMVAEVIQAHGLELDSRKEGPLEGVGSGDLASPRAGGGTPLDSIRGKTKTLNGELKPIRLHVEVKLGAARKSHIAVADFDVPVLLARDFCKIYGLDPCAEQTLAQVVEANMVSNDIPIGAMGAARRVGLREGGDGLALRRNGSRRSIADSTTFSSNNNDFMDDEEYTFYDHSSPQEHSTPLYDHPF